RVLGPAGDVVSQLEEALIPSAEQLVVGPVAAGERLLAAEAADRGVRVVEAGAEGAEFGLAMVGQRRTSGDPGADGLPPLGAHATAAHPITREPSPGSWLVSGGMCARRAARRSLRSHRLPSPS